MVKVGEENSAAEASEVSAAVRKPMKILEPHLPTQAEVDDYNLTHFTYSHLLLALCAWSWLGCGSSPAQA